MSNEILNPDSQFLDATGDPLGAGTLTFYVNLASTTLSTIYSDEALTVAQNNPFTLDAAGRTSANIKYTGKKRMVVKDSSGATIRTIDNVVTAGNDDANTVTTVAAFANLATTPAQVGQKISILGLVTAGDGEGGDFIARAGSVSSDGDNISPSATAVVYWYRVSRDSIEKVIDSYADIATLEVREGQLIRTKYHTGVGYGGNLFIVKSGSPSDNGGTIAVPATSGLYLEAVSTQGKDAAWFGVYPGAANNTAALTLALAAFKTVRIRDEGEYKLENLAAVSNKDLLLDAGVELIGVTTASDIITSSGSIIRFNVVGGKVKDCNNFWTHTGNSALAYCKFNNVQFNDLVAGFDLTSSVGNTWDKCEFGVGGSADNIDYGIYFRATGTGQTNINRLVDCNFLLFRLGGVVFADTAINKIANIIRGCWFEDSAASAIYVGGTTQNLIIDGGYSETCGAAGVPDINIVQSVGSAIIGLKICNMTFQIHNAGQTERIKNTGNSYIKVEDCQVVLNEAGSVFCAVNGASTFHSELYNNYLNATGGGTYQSRLYSRSGTQQVSWSTHVASGVVTNDDQPLRYNEGVNVGNWTTFTNADATPSVRGGNRFKTSGTTTITTFDDGFDGQEIIVKAGNTITVVGVAMVLNDVAEFVNDSGTWRHKNL